MAWFVQLFGSVALRQRGKSQILHSDQFAWMVVVLTSSPHGISRTALCHLFWSEMTDARAKANLRQALMKFKASALGTLLRTNANTIFLEINSDALGFWQAVQRQDHALVLELAQEEFIVLETNNNELLIWREEQRNRIFEAWRISAKHLIKTSSREKAIFIWEKLLEKDILNEELLQLSLVWCKENTKANHGQRWYKRFAVLLEHEMQSKASSKTQDLLKVLEPAVAQRQFFGRRLELEQLHILAKTGQAVSIIGFGGTGKTSLALEALRQLGGDYVLIPLNDVVYLDTLIGRVGQVLGISSSNLEETIPLALEARGGRVLLDNSENLNTEARAYLQALVDSLPDLQWWLTSREPILVRDYQIVLQGLDINETQVLHSAAGQLLLTCAKKANSDFMVSHEKLLLELCQAVRGLPLALEFIGAAARQSNLQTLHQIFVQEKTTDHIVQNILSSSYAALTTAEQVALGGLVILPNQARPELIQHITRTNTIELEQLFIRGWLEQSVTQGLKIHEMVRQFLNPKRSENAEQRLLEYSLTWLEQALSEPTTQTWIAIRQHWNSLETTWRIALQRQDWVFLSQSVWLYWQVIEQLELYLDGMALINVFLTMPKSLQSALLTTRGWCEARLGRSNQALITIQKALMLYKHRFSLEAMAMAHHSTGDFLQSLPHWQLALEAHVLAGDSLGEARVLLQLGDIASETAENEQAQTYFFDALFLARRNNDAALTAKALHLLGALAVHHGQFELGRSRYQEAITHLQPLGKTLSEAKLINNIAVIDHMNHQIEAARAGYQKSLELRRPLGDRKGIAQITSNLAMLEWDHGERKISLQLHETALAERERLGDSRGMVTSHNCLCEVYLHFELHSAATKSAVQATQLALQLGSEVLLYHCLLSFSAIALFEQKFELAARYLAHPRFGNSSKECKFSSEPYALLLEAQLEPERIEQITMQSLKSTIFNQIKQCLESHDAANAVLY